MDKLMRGLGLAAIAVLATAAWAQPRGHRGGSSASRGGYVRRGLDANVSQYASIIERHAATNGVDPALVAAVIHIESRGNARSVSSAGAMGLMQLMPGTCRDFGVSDPFDPEQNISGGTRLLAQNLRRYSGDVDRALAAYNAGPRRVDDGSWVRIGETARYVPAVKAICASIARGTFRTVSVAAPRFVAKVVVAPSAHPLDDMFQAVQACQERSEGATVVENGALDNAAETMLRDAIHRGTVGGAQEGVTERVAQAGYAGGAAEGFVIRTDSPTGFGTAWLQQPIAKGRFIGLAQTKVGSSYCWAVIVAAG